MTEPADTAFQATLVGRERGLTVASIATVPFLRCRADDDVAQTLGRPDLNDFDSIPVEEDGRIVGVLERRTRRPNVTGRVRDMMRRLDGSRVVSADESIERLLPELKRNSYRLVVRGQHLDGIVTTSDLVKRPVRLFAFSLVSHLEALMARVINLECQAWEDWREHLSKTRQKDLQQHFERLSADRLNPSMIQLTSFGEKAAILARRGTFGQVFSSQIGSIRHLRNDVAHTKTLAHDQRSLRTFITRVEQTRSWIDRLNCHFNARGENKQS